MVAAIVLVALATVGLIATRWLLARRARQARIEQDGRVVTERFTQWAREYEERA